MHFLTNLSTDPHWNMAFDEFILEQFPLDEPVFYLWQNRPSVIIGFNQNAYAEVNLDYLSQKGIVLPAAYPAAARSFTTWGTSIIPLQAAPVIWTGITQTI